MQCGEEVSELESDISVPSEGAPPLPPITLQPTRLVLCTVGALALMKRRPVYRYHPSIPPFPLRVPLPPLIPSEGASPFPIPSEDISHLSGAFGRPGYTGSSVLAVRPPGDSPTALLLVICANESSECGQNTKHNQHSG